MIIYALKRFPPLQFGQLLWVQAKTVMAQRMVRPLLTKPPSWVTTHQGPGRDAEAGSGHRDQRVKQDGEEIHGSRVLVTSSVVNLMAVQGVLQLWLL